jgi:hypothetical protein
MRVVHRAHCDQTVTRRPYYVGGAEVQEAVLQVRHAGHRRAQRPRGLPRLGAAAQVD